MKNTSAVVDVLLKSKANADCVNKVLMQYTSHSLQFTEIEGTYAITFISLNCVVYREENGRTSWLQMEDFGRSKGEI